MKSSRIPGNNYYCSQICRMNDRTTAHRSIRLNRHFGKLEDKITQDTTEMLRGLVWNACPTEDAREHPLNIKAPPRHQNKPEVCVKSSSSLLTLFDEYIHYMRASPLKKPDMTFRLLATEGLFSWIRTSVEKAIEGLSFLPIAAFITSG